MKSKTIINALIYTTPLLLIGLLVGSSATARQDGAWGTRGHVTAGWLPGLVHSDWGLEKPFCTGFSPKYGTIITAFHCIDSILEEQETTGEYNVRLGLYQPKLDKYDSATFNITPHKKFLSYDVHIPDPSLIREKCEIPKDVPINQFFDRKSPYSKCGRQYDFAILKSIPKKRKARNSINAPLIYCGSMPRETISMGMGYGYNAKNTEKKYVYDGKGSRFGFLTLAGATKDNKRIRTTSDRENFGRSDFMIIKPGFSGGPQFIANVEGEGRKLMIPEILSYTLLNVTEQIFPSDEYAFGPDVDYSELYMVAVNTSAYSYEHVDTELEESKSTFTGHVVPVGFHKDLLQKHVDHHLLHESCLHEGDPEPIEIKTGDESLNDIEEDGAWGTSIIVYDSELKRR